MTLGILRLGLLGLVVLAPLPFAAVQPGAVLIIELSAAVLALLTVLALADRSVTLPAAARRALLPCGLLLLVGCVQLVPLPDSWVGRLAGPTHDARQQVVAVVPEAAAPLAPASLAPPDTVDALLRLAAYVAIGIAASVAFGERRQRVVLLAAVAISGTFQALYGAAEYLSGHQHIFGYAKRYFLDSATGTFINRNHYAGYLAMTIALTLGLTALGRRAPSGGGLRGLLVRLGDAATLRALLASAAVVAMWIAVFVSYSRGGLGAALVGTIAFVLLPRGSRRLRHVGALLLIPVLLLAWREVRAPGERFLRTDQMEDVGGRLPIWRTSLPIALDYPVVGSGLGTFDRVFALYRTPESRLRPGHAHNDWLQSLVEGGAVSTLLVGWLYLIVLRPRRLLRRLPAPPPSTLALAAALIAIGFHSLIDFPLRMPAVAVLTACVAGALCAAAEPAGVAEYRIREAESP